MLLLLLAWCAQALVLAVWGTALLEAAGRWLGPEAGGKPLPGLPDALWAGLSLQLFAALLASLFFPVGTAYALGMMAATLALGLACRHALGVRARRALRAWRALPRADRALLLASAAWILWQGAQAPAWTDVGMYQAQAIRWTEAYGTVPGIPLFIYSLGYVSAFHGWAAAAGLWGHQAAPSFVCLLLWGHLFILGRRRPEAALFYWGAGLGLFAGYWGWISSPTPDVLVTALVLLSFRWLVAHPALPREPAGWPLFLLWLQLSALLLLKPTGAPAAVLVMGYCVLRRPGLLRLAWVWALPLACGGLWMAKSALTSGYLLFPLWQLDWLAVDYKIPPRLLEGFVEWNHLFARRPLDADWMPARGQGLAAWWPEWWALQRKSDRAWLAAAALFPLGAGWLRRRKKLPEGWRLALGTAAIMALYWQWVLPQFRFGYPYLWLLALLPWAPTAAQALPERWIRRLFRGVAAVGWALACFFSLQNADTAAWPWVRPLPYRPAAGQWVQAGPLRIWQPDERCWLAPLPCSECPPNGNIAPRGPRVEDGFRLIDPALEHAGYRWWEKAHGEAGP